MRLHWPPRWWPWQPRPTPGPAPTPPPEPTPPPVSKDIDQQLLAAHNQQRAKYGKGALQINLILQRMSQSHADTMARNAKMSHDYAGDGSYSSRLDASGYNYSNAGENVAWNQSTVDQLMSDWMNSAGHRANILGDFTECGMAVSYGVNHDPYWCTGFGKPGISAANEDENMLIGGILPHTTDLGNPGYLVAPVNVGRIGI